MKLMLNAYRVRKLQYAGDTWEILPYINLRYRGDTFLETGVYTKSINLEIGWLTWKGVVILQEAY